MKIKVRKGQIWADNDKRSEGRTLEVIGIVQRGGRKHARCKILTPVGGGQLMPGDRKETRIRLTRMRPTSTGYRLIKDIGGSDMDKSGTEKTPQRTPQEINDEFDKRELDLLKVRQRHVQGLMQELSNIWTKYHRRMNTLKEARQAALTQCTQEEQ